MFLAPGSDPRGRACRGFHDARDAHDLVLVVVWSGARGAGQNGISWCGADAQPRALLVQQLRRTCSVVNVRAPAIPPEQPNYLDRDSGDAPNRVGRMSGLTQRQI